MVNDFIKWLSHSEFMMFFPLSCLLPFSGWYMPPSALLSSTSWFNVWISFEGRVNGSERLNENIMSTTVATSFGFSGIEKIRVLLSKRWKGVEGRWWHKRPELQWPGSEMHFDELWVVLKVFQHWLSKRNCACSHKHIKHFYLLENKNWSWDNVKCSDYIWVSWIATHSLHLNQLTFS